MERFRDEAGTSKAPPVLSPFTGKPKRVTRESLQRHNKVAAAPVDEAYVAQIHSGGTTYWIVRKLKE